MKTSVRITHAEWEVMAVVWQRAPVAASAVEAELRDSKQWSLATVRTLLRRLVNKGALVQRSRGQAVPLYAAGFDEGRVRQESESFWDRVLGRAPSAALDSPGQTG